MIRIKQILGGIDKMTLIKKLKIGKANVEIYSDATPEESKNSLIKLYDVINDIADKKREQGINVDDWFYTKEELEELKKKNNQNLLYQNK